MLLTRPIAGVDGTGSAVAPLPMAMGLQEADDSMTIATFDPAQTSGDELRRSYIESGYVLVTGLVDEAARSRDYA